MNNNADIIVGIHLFLNNIITLFYSNEGGIIANREVPVQDVVVELPTGTDVCDIGILTLWCRTAEAIFTQLPISLSLFVSNVSLCSYTEKYAILVIKSGGLWGRGIYFIYIATPIITKLIVVPPHFSIFLNAKYNSKITFIGHYWLLECSCYNLYLMLNYK